MPFSGAVVERTLLFFDLFCCDAIEFDFLGKVVAYLR